MFKKFSGALAILNDSGTQRFQFPLYRNTKNPDLQPGFYVAQSIYKLKTLTSILLFCALHSSVSFAAHTGNCEP